MKNFVVDNSLKNLGKAVLWQYDRAIRLLSIMKHMQVLFFCAIEQFWAKWMERVLSIDSCGEFGCVVWSALLGVPRPSVEGSDGTLHQIAPSVYRRLLKGKYYLANATPSAESIQGYLEIVFGVPGRDAYSDWVVSQCEYGWSTNVDELNNAQGERLQFRINHAYDKGEIFEYFKSVEKENDPGEYEIVKQNYLVKEDISEEENRSFAAVASKLQETDEDADFAHENEMILLKLYDPNGICRKIAGAPNDALRITAEYVVGGTAVSATITRRRRSGVSVIDDGDMAMHYEKSEYFSEMHKDQQSLFEQRRDDVCPYPLGIKTNEPVEEVVFGFDGQENEQYKSCVQYAKGDKFGYVDSKGSSFNWECTDEISAVENVSFESIESKLQKTDYADPFVGPLVEVKPPYPTDKVYMELTYLLANKLSNGEYPPFENVARVVAINRYLPSSFDTSWPTLFSTFPELGPKIDENNSAPFAYFLLKANSLCPGIQDGVRFLYKMPVFAGPSTGEDFATYTYRGYTILTTAKLLQYGDVLGASGSGFSGMVSPSEYGYLDAVGQFAKDNALKPISLEEAKKPIEGVYYPLGSEFFVDGKRIVLDKEGIFGETVSWDDFSAMSGTTLICNSTLRKIKQET